MLPQAQTVAPELTVLTDAMPRTENFSDSEKLACPLHSKFTRTFKEDKSATAGRLKDGIITPKAFFRPDEAAAILVISRRTVYRMIRDGRIPGVKWGCGPWRIPRESLASLLPGERF